MWLIKLVYINNNRQHPKEENIFKFWCWISTSMLKQPTSTRGCGRQTRVKKETEKERISSSLKMLVGGPLSFHPPTLNYLFIPFILSIIVTIQTLDPTITISIIKNIYEYLNLFLYIIAYLFHLLMWNKEYFELTMNI